MVHCIMTVDLEEWFHGLDIPRDLWEQYESRLEFSAYELLRILHEHRASATFFVLADIAKKYPSLISDIQREGHEVASHGSGHQRYLLLSDNAIRDDIVESVNIISDIIGRKPLGFRAPCFSVTKKNIWILEFLTKQGFQYDSSVFPINHDIYGIPDAPRFKYKLDKYNLVEYPISTFKILGLKIPISGGGYFRLFPYLFTRMALKKINNNENQPFVFYIHPWEIDPEQPRIKGLNAFSKFRQYNNLEKTEKRFIKLLRDFQFTPITPQ